MNDLSETINDQSTTIQNLLDTNLKLWTELRLAISNRDLATFKQCIDQQNNLSKFASLKPRLINETLLDCLTQSCQSPLDSLKPSPDGCDFIEFLMFKLHESQCYFVSWDESCKSIVRVYVHQRRQFSPFTLCFLFRCYDLELLKSVFDHDLVDTLCYGNCQNWHLMFVASYQERFFTSSNENIFEGFICRYILLNKLRCLLEQKRSFLTWFAGSLHLYADEYFLQNEETRFKYVLAKLFEGLILNGLLNNSEFKNFYQMLIKRNEEMLSFLNANYNINSVQPNESSDITDGHLVEQADAQKSKFFPNMDLLFPLTLKNVCRLVIKQKMSQYTRGQVEQLPLPNNLKRFIYFDNECDAAFKIFSSVGKTKVN